MTDRTEREGLEPCPFCGGEPERRKTLYGYPVAHWIRCSGCEASSTSYTKSDSAIAAWNRRPTEALAGKGGGDG